MLVRAAWTEQGGFVLSGTNITPLRTAQALLRQRAAAIETAQDGIAILNATGRVVYSNASYVSLFDVKPVTLLAREWTQPYADRDAWAAEMRQALEREGRDARLLTYVGANGEAAYHDVSLTAVEGIGVIVIARDATERVRSEEAQAALQAELEQAQRQEAVSQLAAGIAHDFNNLLSAINGSAMLISTDGSLPDAAKAHANRISAAGNRAARLVNRMLDLGSVSERALVDARAAVLEAGDLAQGLLHPGIDLRMRAGSAPLTLRGSSTEIVQIVTNLILDGQDAMLNGGEIEVSLREMRPAEDTLVDIGALKAGAHYARISVTDSGGGIPEAIWDRIFEPYFSTKGDRGTGMGLAMIAAIVSKANGALGVSSSPQTGTRVEIYLPIELGAMEEGDIDLGSASLKGALILVVDDEVHVAEVLAKMLERLGAEVAVVDDPDLALEAVEDDPGAWSAMVTDYDMPGMNGGTLSARVRASVPDLPIVMVTALARRLDDPNVAAGAVDAVFAKPAKIGQLSEKLAALIEARGKE